MKIRKEYNGPLEMTHDITKGKRKSIIIWQLSKTPTCSFSQLYKDILGISEKVIMEQLNDLLEFEII